MDAVALVNSALVGQHVRVGGQPRQSEFVAEVAPLPVGDGGDEDLVVVGIAEDVVDGPCGLPGRHRAGWLAADLGLRHMRADEERVVLEQRGVDEFAAARGLAHPQCGLDADDSEHPAHDVVDAGAGTQRLAGRTGHIGQSAEHLYDLVERRPVPVGAGQEALEGAVDESGVAGRELLISEADRFHLPDAEVLQQDVGGVDEVEDAVTVGRLGDIELDAVLVAVERGEQPGSGPGQVAGLVAGSAGFDLDDLGAEVGEDHPAAGAHDHMGELDDADVFERQRFGGRLGLGRVGRRGAGRLGAHINPSPRRGRTGRRRPRGWPECRTGSTSGRARRRR